MYSATHDWGVVGAHKFDVKQLDEMKVECTKHCLSTCNYILGYCYDTKRVMTWVAKQARHGFKASNRKSFRRLQLLILFTDFQFRF